MLSIKTFSTELHRKANAAAALRGETLQQLVTRAVQNELERLRLEGGSSQEEQ